MFRAWDGQENLRYKDQKRANLEEWFKLCPPSARGDVEEVVYSWDVNRLRLISDKNKDNKGNKFAEWINMNQDTEIVDYLVLMRECETACANRADPWYYPFKDDPDINMLKSVVGRAKAYSGGRFSARYALQAIRAMFSLNDYDGICELWADKKNEIKSGVIREMITGYVAGAEFRRGNISGSLDYYISINDLSSIRYCLLKMGQDFSDKALLAVVADKCPDSPEVPKLLQMILYGIEDDFGGYSDHNAWQKMDYKQRMTAKRGNPEANSKYLRTCLKGASKSKSPAIWYYSAAFLADLNAQPAKASQYLASAERTNKDVFLGESIKVMRIYLDSRLSTYNSEYENRLFEDLKWLDKKIVGGITDDVREQTEWGYKLHSGFSYYYWNDMMRKIVIGEVCPRMEDAGKGVLALRLMNMADNRLHNLVGTVRDFWYERKGKEYEYVEKILSLAEYRLNVRHDNDFDYCNYFFKCMDKIGLGVLIKYAAAAGYPATDFERFLDERGYIDKDYITEVIGTRYLRMQQYTKAVKWLSKVSSGYQNRTNVYPYFSRDPFQVYDRSSEIPENYKLTFARKMEALEKQTHSSDPDVRGVAMVKMGTGLRSSFGNCWALTQYHLFCEDEWREFPETKAALAKAEEMIDDGLKMIVDEEKAAEAYLSQHYYISIMEKFPDTKVAAELRANCDKLKDYK